MALVLLSPLLLVVAVLIKTGSPGPVFFATTVVGKDRRSFVWHKLRSMRVMSEAEDIERRRAKFQAFVEATRASADESLPGSETTHKKVIENRRVTPVGRFIRKFSIDELPQLWNVLRGEMSLVGPRPCLPYEEEFYTDWRGQRFRVQPGLSGIWQVFGRGRVGFDAAAAMDVYYVYRRSFQFDLYLIYKTLGVVFTGRGAL
jgi:lipopolysaccharide/colanic/teichoic acid biosynthesis glycosyltransferase